jgi:hypothetical protein
MDGAGADDDMRVERLDLGCRSDMRTLPPSLFLVAFPGI